MCLPYGVDSTLWQIKAMPGTRESCKYLSVKNVMVSPSHTHTNSLRVRAHTLILNKTLNTSFPEIAKGLLSYYQEDK